MQPKSVNSDELPFTNGSDTSHTNYYNPKVLTRDITSFAMQSNKMPLDCHIHYLIPGLARDQGSQCSLSPLSCYTKSPTMQCILMLLFCHPFLSNASSTYPSQLIISYYDPCGPIIDNIGLWKATQCKGNSYCMMNVYHLVFLKCFFL
jgi:hypothetical protein